MTVYHARTNSDTIPKEGLWKRNLLTGAGRQLSQVQAGLEPDHWKAFDEVGAGTKEIIIDLDDGWFRVMYVAKFSEAVYVLHCFRKKTNTTSKQDKSIATDRYKAVIRERSKK